MSGLNAGIKSCPVKYGGVVKWVTLGDVTTESEKQLKRGSQPVSDQTPCRFDSCLPLLKTLRTEVAEKSMLTNNM